MTAKAIINTVFALGLALILAVPAITAMQAPEGDLTMKVPDEVKSSRPKVVFNHKFHEEFDCARCHHQWDGENVENVQACDASGCHDDYQDKRSKEGYYQAFHGRGEHGASPESCMACHRAMGKAGEKSGPTSCAKGQSCHVFE